VRPFLIALLSLACACGGGGDAVTTTDANAAGRGAGNGEPSELTALDVLEACVSTDLADFAELFELIGGLLDGNSTEQLPEPEIDFGKLLTEQKIGWSYDLDQDGSADVDGTLFFTNASGATTVPFSFLDIIGWVANPPEDPFELLAAVPDGTNLHVTWSFDELPLTTSDAAGTGELAFGIADGGLDSASGSAVLTTGGCQFDFSFDEITLDLSNPALPAAEAAFSADTGDHTVTGKATFNGTSRVEFEAQLDDGEPEVFAFDITEGLGLLNG
jgi:hypothetical protein